MNSIIIVEGIHDEMLIKSIYPEANVIITNGSEIKEETLAMIQKLSKNNEIIVFTDPDYPGERIRNLVTAVVPEAKQAFIRKKDAISHNKKKVGVEHASKETIIASLSNLISNSNQPKTITNLDLYELGLNGREKSAQLRGKISERLNIGRPNVKMFLTRLNLLQITKEELQRICQELEM